jgi:hypothetical protein
MLNTEYEREFSYNIDDYLIANYPKMTLAVRRAICGMAWDYIDETFLEEAIDEAVSGYALAKLEIAKLEPEDDE